MASYKSETPTRNEVPTPPQPPCRAKCFAVDVTLRVLLFAASVSAVVDMVTSKQTKVVALPIAPYSDEIAAKFNQSPAFIYFVVALSVAGLYSLITALISLSVRSKPSFYKKYLLLLIFWDVLMLGVVASATGAAGAVAYVGLKGNDHTGWAEICSVYDRFCRHIGSSCAISLFASILLVLLSMLSTYSLYIRLRD